MPLAPSVPEGTTMLPRGTFAGRIVAITGGGTGLGAPSQPSLRLPPPPGTASMAMSCCFIL